MFGAIIGGLGALAGGLLSSSSKNKATAAQKDVALQELEYQKELHKNQVQWRVEDAKKAGLHPLAGLGLSSASYSPVSGNIDSSGTDYSWLGDVGQNLNRAIQQGKTAKERQEALDRQKQKDDIDLRKANADADLAETNAAAARFALQQQLFPPSPVANQVTDPQLPSGVKPDNQGLYVDKPIVRDGWLLDEKGRKVGIIPSEGAAQRFEDKLILEWVPFGGSFVRGFRGKFLGQEVNGHWWHGDDKGFLPYPPKKGKSYASHVGDVIRFYSDYDD